MSQARKLLYGFFKKIGAEQLFVIALEESWQKAVEECEKQGYKLSNPHNQIYDNRFEIRSSWCKCLCDEEQHVIIPSSEEFLREGYRWFSISFPDFSYEVNDRGRCRISPIAWYPNNNRKTITANYVIDGRSNVCVQNKDNVQEACMHTDSNERKTMAACDQGATKWPFLCEDRNPEKTHGDVDPPTISMVYLRSILCQSCLVKAHEHVNMCRPDAHPTTGTNGSKRRKKKKKKKNKKQESDKAQSDLGPSVPKPAVTDVPVNTQRNADTTRPAHCPTIQRPTDEVWDPQSAKSFGFLRKARFMLLLLCAMAIVGMPPRLPGDVRATYNPLDKTIVVSWPKLPNVAKYYIEVDGKQYATLENHFVHKDLKPSSRYAYKVWGQSFFCIHGYETKSNEVFTPPGTIEDLRLYNVENKICASWVEHPELYVSYRVQVYKDGSPLGEENNIQSGGVCAPSPEPSTPYSFEVWLVNSHGVHGEKKRTKAIISKPGQVQKLGVVKEGERICAFWRKSYENTIVQVYKEASPEGAAVTIVSDNKYCITPQTSTFYMFEIWSVDAHGLHGEKKRTDPVLSNARDIGFLEPIMAYPFFSFGFATVLLALGFIIGVLYANLGRSQRPQGRLC